MTKLIFLYLLFAHALSAHTPDSHIIGSKLNTWSQGGLQVTDRLLDIAIQGNGFFMVENEMGDSCFTRHGRFELSKNGYLRSSHLNGLLVTINNGTDLSPLNLSHIARFHGSELGSVKIDFNGEIVAFYKNGRSKTVARIALALFQNHRNLLRIDDHCLVPTSDSGEPYLDFAQVDGRGSIYSSTLESLSEIIYRSSLNNYRKNAP